jgi:hypothetical protein
LEDVKVNIDYLYVTGAVLQCVDILSCPEKLLMMNAPCVRCPTGIKEIQYG